MTEPAYPCHNEYYILKFSDVDEIICFLHDIWPDSVEWRNIYEEDKGSEWLFIIAVCIICGNHVSYCTPAETYENGIVGCECPKCKYYSLFPMKGSFRNA